MKKIVYVLMSIILISCTVTNNSIMEVKNPKYILIEMDNKKNIKEKGITINIDKENNKFYGYSAINSYMGSIINGKIQDNIGMTLMAGPIEDMMLENEYLSNLKDTTNIIYKDNLLIMELSNGKKMVFEYDKK